jgi:hypothetical protein
MLDMANRAKSVVLCNGERRIAELSGIRRFAKVEKIERDDEISQKFDHARSVGV